MFTPVRSRSVMFPTARAVRFFRLAALLLIALALIPAAPPAAHAQGCDGLAPTRLSVGTPVRVLSTYGLSLKNQPMTGASGAAELAQLSYGMVGTVLDGYRCVDGYTWWQIDFPGHPTGWAAEGDAFNYFLEPTAIALHTFRPTPDGTALAHDTVTPTGQAASQGVIPLADVAAPAGELWQAVEFDYLMPALERLRATCPERLTGTLWEAVTTRDDAEALPITARDMSFVPAPDGSGIVVLRDFTRDLPRCDTVLTERVGITRVSLLAPDGTETELFPYAQHSSIPPSEDRYRLDDPTRPAVWLSEITWSPDSQYIAFVAAYRDTCDGEPCARFHLYVLRVATGQLFVLGEGRHAGWQNGSARLNFFRLVGDPATGQIAHLYNTAPDGADRQEVYLPGGAEYVSATHQPTGFPWNISGTAVLVANRGGGEVMLYDLNARDFSPRVVLPDPVPAVNRLAVHLVRGESSYLWVTIRGDFILQSVERGTWERMQSQVATTGIPLREVRPFPGGTHALLTLADHSAYVLDLAADTLTPVVFP